MFFEGKQRHILLVEDNDEIRLTLAQTLELEKFVVHTAEHGLAALRLLQEITPDIILSDINMPRMDGIQLYRQMKKNPRLREIPVIFLTAGDGLQSSLPDSGPDTQDCLLKPFDITDLVAIIRSHLKRSEQRQNARL